MKNRLIIFLLAIVPDLFDIPGLDKNLLLRYANWFWLKMKGMEWAP